ncbi:MAG: hypothetical protein A2033_18775 [Bacteroidetes bacterium GWA2_31_9]|nr:MAG: hypothetical protein A2033_18775 [Bacteroidetes bacterium GWA2_31_9]
MEKDKKSDSGFKKGNIDAALLTFIKEKNIGEIHESQEVIKEEPEVKVKEKKKIVEKVTATKATKKEKKINTVSSTENAAIIIKASNYKTLKFKSISESIAMKTIISELFHESRKLKLNIQEMQDYIISKRAEKGRLITIDKDLNKEILLQALKLDATGNGYLNYLLSISLK